MSRILLIEDEVVIRRALRSLLERHHHEVLEAGSVSEALDNHDLSTVDLIITDLRLPGAPGTDIISRAAATPVLVMTSYASVRSAVESIKLGAVDYISKPFDHDEMLLLVRRILEQSQQKRRCAGLQADLERTYPVHAQAGEMVGNTPAMKKVFDLVRKFANTDTTILISGESGTGKELVARALHAQGQRASGPFITVNCAAIPEAAIETELFGYVKGAFPNADTGHQGLIDAAEGGTLFLDEVAELSPAAQSRLLRVLTDGEIRPIGSSHSRRANVRVVASTQTELKKRADDNAFRADLYYRLQVMEIQLPTLKQREQDIPVLADALLTKTCKRLNRPQLEFSDQARAALQQHDWPGNVRELENCIERAVILTDQGQIDSEDLSISQSPGTTPPADLQARPELSLEDYFRHFVTRNQDRLSETDLAQKLGISRKALWERRLRLGLERPKKKGSRG